MTRAEKIYGLTQVNQLVEFQSDAPGVIQDTIALDGLQPGEQMLAIDFRPASGQLYGLGSSSRLYIIDPATSPASAVASEPFTPALDGNSFGFDFNPIVDRVRLVSNTGQNLRLNPATGVTVAVDTGLQYAPGDPNEGTTPRVAGAAYVNNFSGALVTTLYDIDFNLDVLLTQNPPNNGSLNTVGPLGVNVSSAIGFDITSDNRAFASFAVGGTSGLYSINLSTGAATLIGSIGSNLTLLDIAVAYQKNEARDWTLYE